MKNGENFWDSSRIRYVVMAITLSCLLTLLDVRASNNYYRVIEYVPNHGNNYYVNIVVENRVNAYLYCTVVTGSYDYDFWVEPFRMSRPYRVQQGNYSVFCVLK